MREEREEEVVLKEAAVVMIGTMIAAVVEGWENERLHPARGRQWEVFGGMGMSRESSRAWALGVGGKEARSCWKRTDRQGCRAGPDGSSGIIGSRNRSTGVKKSFSTTAGKL